MIFRLILPVGPPILNLKLKQANLRLIIQIEKKYTGREVHFHDLIRDGSFPGSGSLPILLM